MRNAFSYIDEQVASGNRNIQLEDVFKAGNLSEDSQKAYGDRLKEELKYLNGLPEKSKAASSAMDYFKKSQAEAGEEIIDTSTTMEKLKSGLSSFGQTAKAVAVDVGTNFLISAGLQATAAGIDYVVNKQTNTIKAGSEVLSDYQNINQQMSESTSWVKTNAERYEELSKGVNNLGQNLSLTSADYEEYQQLSSQIAQQFPELVTGYDSLGKPIIGAAKSVSDLQTALKNAKFDAYNKNVKEAKDVTGKFYEEVMRSKTLPWQDAGSQKQLDGLEQFIKDYNKAFSTKGGNKPTGYIDLQKYMNMSTNAETGFNASDFGEAYQTLGLSQADIQDLIQDLNSSNGKLKSGSDSAKTLTTLMVGELQSDVDNSANELKQYIPSFLQANKKYQDLILDNDGLDSKVTSMINAMTMEDLESNGFTDKDNAADNIKKWASNVVNELDKSDIRDSIDSLFSFNENHAEDTAKDWYTTANAALDEADAKSESFNKKQLQEASGIYDEWLKVKDAMASITSRYGDTTREDAIRRFNTEDLEALGEIASADTDHKLSYDDAISQIENQKRQAELSVANLQKSVESITSQYSTISSAISDSMSDTGLSKDSIDAVKSSVQDVINSTDELKDFDLDGLFTNTSKGVKLNNSQLENLLDIQKDIKEQDFAKSISQQTDELDKQAKQAEILKAKYGETSDEYVEALEKQKQAQEDLNATQQAQSQYYAQYQQQKQLFSDYAEWQRATQTENSGDKYLSMVSGLDTAKKAWDAGEIGTDDFKSFAKMISPSGATDPVNFAENYAKAARYLTSDESGLVHFFEDLSTKTDAAGQAMASFNEETQSWELNTHDLGEVAQKLGTGTPVVEALFGRAEDYGATTTVISDMQDGILKATEATKNWSEAKARLDQMNEENAQAQKDGKDPIYNTTAIKAAEDEVAKYKQQIDGLQESMDYYAEHNLGSEAQQKKMKTAADEIKNIQEQVQAAENANNKALADSYRNMAKEKAAAAGITVDDNLNVTGDGKTAQEQLKEKSSSTSSTLSGIDFDYDKTTMSLDQIDSKIKELQDAKVNVDVAVDGEDAVNTLDTEISSLEAQKVQVQIQTAVENGNSFQELLTLSDQELMATVGCDASQVDQVRDEIQEMSGEQIDMTVAMNSDQFVALINAITGEKIEVPVEANTDGVEAETKSAVEGTEAKVTPQVDTSQVESETQSAVQNAAEGTKPSVDVTGNVTTLTAGTGLTPVAVTGNVVQLTGTPSQPVDVNANVTTVTGTPSGTVDVNANATTISGEPSGTVDVKGNVTSVTGTPSGTVNVKGNITAGKVENANGTTSSGTINYKKGEVEKADGTKSTGTIDYKKGNVEKADGTVSTGVINYDLGTVATPKSATATGVINYTLGTVAKPKASGTMSAPSSSPAHASGTVYNVTNYGSAYANGKVGLQRSETALVNEIGQESIIRGDRWLMLPPGMHTQSLKKGDIVLNAQQTADLLAHGKANGTARAYAHGSLSDIAPAHANSPGVGAATLKFQGGLASPKYGNTKSSGKTSGDNTSATKANTNATKANTKSTKKSTSAFDYVARKLTYFANKTKEIADKINDYVSSAFKTSQLKKQISAISNEITVNSKGANAYLKKANSIGLSAKVKKDVREGKYAITEYNTSTSSKKSGTKSQYEKIQEYAKYYDEYVKCTQAVQDLKNQQLELFEQWANMPTEAAEKKIEKLKNGFNGLTAIQARLKTANLGGSAQAYLNNEMKSSVNSSANARNSAKTNLDSANSRLSSANRSLSNVQKTESRAKSQSNKDTKALNSATKKLKKNKSVTLTSSEKKRIASGKALSTKGLKGKKKTLVQKYNAALKKNNSSKSVLSHAQSATKSASNAVNIARSSVNSARSAYNSANATYAEYQKQYSQSSKYLANGDTLGYQNYLTDMELQNTKEQNKANQDAYAQATKNTQDTIAQKNAAASKLQSAKNNQANAKKKGSSLAKKYKNKLNRSQINALNAGKTVSTKGIKSKSLKKQLDAYNKSLTNTANAVRDAQANLEQLTTQVDIATNAEAEAAANAAESQAELAQAAIEAEQTKFENISDYYDKRLDYQKALAEKEEKLRDLSEAHGNYTKSSDYDTQITEQTNQRAIATEKLTKMQEQLKNSMDSGVIKEGSDEWLEMSTKIAEAESAVKEFDTDIENLKQKQLTTKYEEMFDRAIEKADKFISKLDNINDLLTEEMMYDYDTGQLTDMGALSLTLNAQSMNDSLDTLQNYAKKRQQIIDDYNNKLFGEQKYDELMSENDSNIQNALKNANSYKQQILSIVKTQSQKEQDALFKVIDARKEALKKKKEYYDYDKQLKSKTKEINLLQQQIDALDGVTDAESRAQKAKLEAQLKDAQDDLDDTVRDHVYDLQVDGLDDLEDQLKEDFEKWSNELSGNLDKMSKAINDAINNSGASAADAMNTLAEVLKQFNITPDQLGISASNLSAGNIKKYAKGTDHVGHNSIGLTNENGREIVVTRKGWLTKLGASDMIIPNDITETLVHMAEQYQNRDMISSIKMPEIKSDGDKNVVYNYTNNNPITIQGDLVRDTLPDLKTILKKSNEYTQNEMRKNLRRT